MLLNPIERITILPILAKIKTTDFYICYIIESCMNQCSFGPEELEELGIKDNDKGNFVIPPEAFGKTKEIEFPHILKDKVRQFILNLDLAALPPGQVQQYYHVLKTVDPDFIPEAPGSQEVGQEDSIEEK